MQYTGDWYGENCIWSDYEYIKTPDDPSFWPDKQTRVKPLSDHRPNGGFALKWALDEKLIKPLEVNT